jgi:hypothetical protein
MRQSRLDAQTITGKSSIGALWRSDTTTTEDKANLGLGCRQQTQSHLYLKGVIPSESS